MTLSDYLNVSKENSFLVLMIIILIIISGLNISLSLNKPSHTANTPEQSDSKAINDNKQSDMTTLQDMLRTLVIRLDSIEKQQHMLVEKTDRIQLQHQNSHATQLARPEHGPEHDSSQWVETIEPTKLDPVESYDQTMLQEAVDDTWKMQLDVQINTMLSEVENTETAIHSLECRESVCRVELIHTDSTAETAWLESMASSEIFSGEMYAESSVNESGEEITLVYLSKP